MCSTRCEIFGKLSLTASRETTKGIETIRGGLGQSIWRAATGQPQLEPVGVSWEIRPGSLLASYAGTTQVWQVTDRLREGAHFIVLYYRRPNQSDGMLRPFALPAASGGRDLLTVKALREVIGSVSTMDRERHPEWFSQ